MLLLSFMLLVLVYVAHLVQSLLNLDNTQIAMVELAQLQASAGQAATLLKPMSHPKRLLILCMLSGSPSTSAEELTRVTRLSASTTSQHLARMRDGGLIDSQRGTQRILYPTKDEAVNTVIATLKNAYCL